MSTLSRSAAILFLFLFLFSLQATAQIPAKIDSLEKLLPYAKAAALADILNSLAHEYFRIDPDKTKDYATRALAASRPLGYNKGIGEGFSNMALHYLMKGDHDECFRNLDSSLIYANAGNILPLKASVYNIKGVLFFNKGNLNEALKYFEESLSLKKKLGDKSEIAKTQSNIGSIYLKLHYHDKALENYLEVLKMDEERKDTLAMASDYNNIGIIYIDKKEFTKARTYLEKALATSQADKMLRANCLKNISTIEFKQKDYVSAMETSKKSLALFEELSNKRGIYSNYNSIGICYEHLGNYPKALEYLTKSLAMKEELGDESEMASTLGNMGPVYWKSGDPNKAIAFLERSNVIAVKYRDLSVMRNNYEMLTLIYAQLNNTAKMNESFGLYHAYSDTLREIETSNTIGQIQEEYETEKREKEIAILSQEKILQELKTKQEEEKRIVQVSMLGLVIIVLAGGGWIVNSRNRLKQQKEQFRSVIEAEEKERRRIAMELHDGLGQLLSTARLNVSGLEDAVNDEDASYVKTSMTLIDEACEEVRSISHNLMPGTLIKLGLVPAITQLVSSINKTGKLKVSFNHDKLDGALSQEGEVALYRVVQESLTNIIKYAKAANASVNITRNAGKLSVRIEDDGVGMDVKIIDKSEGIGWSNIRSRVDMLNGKLEVRSAAGKGTAVDIKVFCN